MNVFKIKVMGLSSLILMFSAATIQASDAAYRLNEIKIIGDSLSDLAKVPGSATIITTEQIKASQPFTANELLKNVPGVTVRDEEGMGRRPNISFRGMSTDRSRKVLILEDGVPVSLAPYGENAAYYSPDIDRISQVEVRKGSSSILYGPQTLAGVINYMTPSIPLERDASVKTIVGGNGFNSLNYRYGNSFGNSGVFVSLLRKSGEGAREDMPFQIYDLTSKLSTSLTDRSGLMFKWHYFNEESNVSYLGLTQSEYEANPNQNPAKNDVLYVERLGLSVLHDYQASADTLIQTSVYGHLIKRDWWRQDFSRDDTTGAVTFKDSNGGRNRFYKVLGIEPRVEKGNWTFGTKLHFEEERNQRINGNSATARTAAKGIASTSGLQDDEIRSTVASSGFAQYQRPLSNQIQVSAGLRAEAYQQRRQVMINQSIYETAVVNEVTEDQTQPFTESTDWQHVLIPGAGLTFQVSDQIQLFSGLHRGFAPPRFSDAIDSSGDDQKLDAEESWNYELGARAQIKGVTVTGTGFYTDYQNQVISATDSANTKVNAGKSRAQGLELDLQPNPIKMGKFELGARLGLTLTDSVFLDNRDGKDTKGKQIPYVPKESGSLGITFSHENGFQSGLDWQFSGQQFSDDINTIAASPSGQTGALPAYSVLNASASLPVLSSGQLYMSVKNVLDAQYIASRHPQGIFPGLGRYVSVGVEWSY